MTPGQRRMLWLCTFLLAFIFFWEAGGEPLIRRSEAPPPPRGAVLEAHHYGQMAYGAVFLLLGGTLSYLFAKRSVNLPGADATPAPPYHPLDWAALAAGLGLLCGIAWRSYMLVYGGG
ncbi:MAG: hypothetical protein M5U26_29670 [Planctomycetota bacterium]|nr:hypothetical protein [Planctomycetota bacterium]